jgi:hypothetical protein
VSGLFHTDIAVDIDHESVFLDEDGVDFQAIERDLVAR